MSQLNNKSFNVVHKMIKVGYQVVGSWQEGVVLQKGDDIQIVPYEISSKVASDCKVDFIKNEKEKENREEVFKLYKHNFASEAQVRSCAQKEDVRGL